MRNNSYKNSHENNFVEVCLILNGVEWEKRLVKEWKPKWKAIKLSLEKRDWEKQKEIYRHNAMQSKAFQKEGQKYNLWLD